MKNLSKKAVSFMLSIVMLCLCMTLSSCGNNSGKEKLVVVTWGGASTDAQREAIFKPFEEKFNCEIIEVTPVDYGKFQAMVQAGNVEWDVVDCDTDFAIRAEKNGWLEQLDYSVIDVKNMDTVFVRDCSITSYIYGYSLGYNTKKYADEYPTNWRDFWDVEKFPGNRSLWKYAPGTMEIALLADGVLMENLYPLDIDRAFRSLDKIKNHITVWWTSASQTAQFLSDESIDIAAVSLGRIFEAMDNGAPVNYEMNQTAIFNDSWVIPKGTQKKELAMQFVNFAMNPEVQANVAKGYPYSPSITEAFDFLTDAEKERQPGNPDVIDNQFYIDSAYWAENYDSINERFQEWLIK